MSIIVPIHVEALRVSPSTMQTSLDALYDFSDLGTHPSAAIGGLNAASSFRDRFHRLRPGIHVHWSIPRAYTRGSQDRDSGQLVFPTLPNRWLVTRFLREQPGGTPGIARWLLESDAIGEGGEHDPDAMPLPVPVMKDTGISGLSHANLGRRVSLRGKSWVEQATSATHIGKDLHALFAYGETFTAYYRHGAGALGLYDSLGDIGQDLDSAAFSASYSVIGWVNEPAHDVLQQALGTYDPELHPDFEAFVKGVLEGKLGWQLGDAGAITPANRGTARGLLAGTVAGISWSTQGQVGRSYPTDLPDGSQLAVAIGGSTAEAISAYIAGTENDDSTRDPDSVVSSLEWLLNAFQYGQLQRLAAGRVGVGQLDEFLHEKSFVARRGGYRWTVRPAEGAPADIGAAAGLPLAAVQLLEHLNRAQAELEACQDEIEARRKKLFFDWSYHVTTLDENVFGPDQPNRLQDDVSRAYVLDGLSSLFPLYMRAGMSERCGRPGAFPCAYSPDPFAILAPKERAPELAQHRFNARSNPVAEAAVQRLIAWQYDLAAVLPMGLERLQDGLRGALRLLGEHAAGAAEAKEREVKILDLLAGAQAVAGGLAAAFARVVQPKEGLDALGGELDGAVSRLAAFWDGSASSGELARWFPIQDGGLGRSGALYRGKIVDLPHFQHARAWQRRDDFPGLADLIQRLSTPGILDTESAALHLAITYLWACSDETAKGQPAAYRIELAEQGISSATAAARRAGEAVRTAASGHVASLSVGRGLSRLASTGADGAIEVIRGAVNEGRSADAIAVLRALLAEGQGSPEPASLPALLAAVRAPGWTEMVRALESAWQAIADGLPLAHRVHILGSFLCQILPASRTLCQTPADSYFEPSEPVIVLGEGKDGDRILRSVDRNGRASRLPCRSPAELVTCSQSDITAFPREIQDIGETIDPRIDGLMAEIQALLREAYLLTPEYEKRGVPATSLAATAADNQQAQEPLSTGITLHPASGRLPYGGKLPYFTAYNYWQPTSGAIGHDAVYRDVFLPLLVYWEAKHVWANAYDSAAESYPSSYLTDLFASDEYGIDYQPISPDPFRMSTTARNEGTVRGVISLSSAATANLREQVRTFCLQSLGGYDPASGVPAPGDVDRDEKLRMFETYDAFGRWSVLSQSLSGFHLGLRQRAQELQIPIHIPSAWQATAPNGGADFWVTQLLRDQSAGWAHAFADEGLNLDAFEKGDQKAHFTPLRAGFLRISQLHIVDVFGRRITVASPDPRYIAEALQVRGSQGRPPAADGASPDDAHKVYLPPRLLQPARVSLEWVPADASAASPICAWFMPNHLDESLMVFDGQGRPVGSVGRRKDSVHWFPAPGAAVVPPSSVADPVLRSFLQTWADPALKFTAFQGFLEVLDRSQHFIITPSMKHDRDLAVLTGRPLVLARIALRLELRGPPDTALGERPGVGGPFQLDESGYLRYELARFNDADLPGLSIPVRLGDPQITRPNAEPIPYFDDGLVGFFVGDDPTFYTPLPLDVSLKGIRSTFALQAGQLPIQLKPGGAAKIVTLVLDPRAVVRATTGVLPVARIGVPPDQYSQALSRLMVSFLTAPVLIHRRGGAADMEMPVPPEKGHRWHWYQVGAPDVPVKAPQAGADAVFPHDAAPVLIDGWLKLKKAEV